MKKLTILLILLAITLVSKAQTVYPVRTYTVLTPPMPYTLSGFASEPGRMQLNINVDDVSLESYAVYFRLVIKGNGIKLHTKPTMYQEPFYLDGGMHEVLTGMDLEPLFNPKNLLFEGYSLREYERTGRLPEGVYQISVELWDYYHKINISQAMPGVAVMYLTRAPRLTFPTKDAEVDLISNPTLRFSWMGSIPNDPQTDPVYRFSLYEIRPEGRNPYEVVKVSPPIFTEDTKQPYLLYDMGMPPLENGMEYAWQVQSVDLEERARFQNDGLSEVYNFSYGQSCETPEVQITGVTTTTVQLKLSNNPNIQLYRVFYKTTDGQDWKSTETDVPTITLSGLKENSGYEIKVTALCGGEESDESNPVRCKTNLDVDYTCGKTPNNFDVSNTEPLQELHRFDFFKAADFSIEVIEAEGSNGRFSGKGLALVPYLGFVKFMVEFENIFINADRRMTEGSVQFIYDEESGMVVNLGKILNNDDDDDDENVVDADKSVEASTDVEIKVDGEITNIQISDSTVTVKTDSGKTETITVNKGQTVGITTEEGKTVYVADTGSGEVFTAPNPKRNKAKTSSVGTSAQTGEYGTTALFKPAKQQKYGFDAVPKSSNKKPNSYFNTNKSRDKIAWKSLATGRTDYLDVQIKGKSSDTLRYIRSSGMLAPFNKSKLGDQLLLTGIPEGEEETLIAASIKKERIDSSKINEILTEVGAIGLVSYQPIQKDVVLVSLNGAQCPTGTGAIKTALDKIYSPAIVSWNVKIDQHFTFEGLSSESFKTSGTGIFSKYTSDMSSVVEAFKKDRSIQQGTYYLFFVDEPQTNKQGFMPLTGQYGFIFNFGHNTNVLAHELAHGVFNLRHTFSSKAQHYFPERTTQNLMDYANGEELWKYQWDLIHKNVPLFSESLPQSDYDSNNDTTNLNIGSGVKKGDILKLGPISLLINSNPESLMEGSDSCEFKVDSIDFQLKMEDVNMGIYEIPIINASLIYSVDCEEGILNSAEIIWSDSEGVPINNIGIIDALVKDLHLRIGSKGQISGSVGLKALLDKDVTVNSVFVVKEGLSGEFDFVFSSADDGFIGAFNYHGIEDINIDLLKNEKILASVKNGTLNENGHLNSAISFNQAISYNENGFQIALEELSGNVQYDFIQNQIEFKTLDGQANIDNIPGINTSLALVISVKDSLIQAQINNVNPISIYGITLESNSLEAIFDKQFKLSEIKGEDLSCSYSKSKNGKTLSGNLTIKSILIKNNKIESISGEGSVAYDPFAKISLYGAEYNMNSQCIDFQAEVDVALNSDNKSESTISKVSIYQDGSYNVGEISVDLLATMGPVKVEFSKKPGYSNKVKSMEATVTVDVKEKDIDKTLSFSASAEYINTKDGGLKYIKVDADDLDLDFPPIYNINTKVQAVSFEYTKNDDDTESYNGNVSLNASLDENKFIYKDVIMIKKGVSGSIEYSYNSSNNVVGTFDLSNLQGLELHLVKSDKTAATLKGSINDEGLLTGSFAVSEAQTFVNAGFKTTLKKFDINSSYHFKTSEFNFISGNGIANISDIKGIEGELEVQLEYLDNNISSRLSSDNQKLYFCKNEISDLDFSIVLDADLNLSEIGGGFAIQPEGLSSKLQISNVLIKSGELKSLKVKGNVDYKAFKFDLLSGSYNNSALDISAKVLLGDAYAAVDKFIIDAEGEISIGKVEGEMKSTLMELNFKAAFGDNSFSGNFDATLAKKLGVKGTVDMGSSICSNCDNGSFNYGYYGLTVSSSIPIFPGVSISKLGGQFGYNYEIDFKSKNKSGRPVLNSNLVGLSFGLQDNAGLIELAVDPAIYQWSKDEATISMTGTIKAPKNKPVFTGSANVNLDIPSYDIYGSLGATVKIPAKSGYIIDASQNMNFVMTDTEKTFSSTSMTAKIIRSINYEGSFSNTRLYNESGVLTSSSGYIDGSLTYGFNYKKNYEGTSYRLDCDFNFNFEAGLSTKFNDSGLAAAVVTGTINAAGNIDASVLGCSFNPYVSLSGQAGLKYINPLWQLNAKYNFMVGLKSLGELEFDGEYSNTFE